MSTGRGRSPSPNAKLTEEQKKAQELAKSALRKRAQKQQGIYDRYGYQIIGMVVLALLSTILSTKKDPNTTPVIEQDEIEAYNSQDLTFKLGPNDFFNQWMLADAKKVLNTQLAHKQQLSYCPTKESKQILPESYDFRVANKKCSQPVQNQGNCSSSYAVAAASTIADRYCLLKGISEKLSPQPLIACDTNFTMGCDGGYVSRSFDYAKRHGLVQESCLPFNVDNNDKCEESKKCQRYKIAEQCVATEEEGIKQEIYKNGPVVAVVPMYRDLLIYKEGIYQVLEGASKFQSGHALKIIGWGRDETTKLDYWIVENSWGESWGEKGFARIATKQESLYLDSYALGINTVFFKYQLAPTIELPKAAESEKDSAPQQEAEIQDLD